MQEVSCGLAQDERPKQPSQERDTPIEGVTTVDPIIDPPPSRPPFEGPKGGGDGTDCR